jgi:dTDP-4-amino-4,6-dideoxy-D-glucose acyltransferase
MSFLTTQELLKIGFSSCGSNVLISKLASIYGAEKINIGSNVRIDDFCILSAGDGGIYLGNHVHIACYSSLIGQGRITLEDFSNVSSRVSIYSSSDDYSGKKLTNPTISENYKNVTHGPVIVKRHTIIGSGSVILPNIILNEGCAIGALSLVNSDCEEFSIYAGIPAKKIKNRSKKLLDIEKEFLNAQ